MTCPTPISTRWDASYTIGPTIKSICCSARFLRAFQRVTDCSLRKNCSTRTASDRCTRTCNRSICSWSPKAASAHWVNTRDLPAGPASQKSTLPGESHLAAPCQEGPDLLLGRSVSSHCSQARKTASHHRGRTYILVAAFYMLKRNEVYRDAGGDYFEKANPEALRRYLVKRLERLGNKVILEPVTAA